MASPFSLASHILAFLFVFLLLAPVYVVADSVSHTTCSQSVIQNKSQFGWWNNEAGQNPCEVLEALLRQCDPDHTIHVMPQSPLHSPDICVAQSGTQDKSGEDDSKQDFTPCCCNTVAFALRQACWSCQRGAEAPSAPHRRPTFREYLQCPKNVDNSKEVFVNASVPFWTFIPIDPDNTWDFNFAKAFATGPQIMMATPPTPPGNVSNSGDDGGDGSKSATQSSPSPPGGDSDNTTLILAIVGGVLAGLAGVACALGVIICVQRRRRRRKAQPVVDIPPAWFIRGAYEEPSFVRRSFADVDMDTVPPIPRPTLGRGKLGPATGIGMGRGRMSGQSWSSSLAKEPLIPRAGSTLEARDVQYSATSPGYGTQGMRPPVPTFVSVSNTHSFSL